MEVVLETWKKEAADIWKDQVDSDSG